MPDTFQHGIYIREENTPLVPSRRVTASLPVFIGTAPIWKTEDHRTDAVAVPILAQDLSEAQTWLGDDASWSDYSLCEAMSGFFGLYGMGPAILINAFDPYGKAAHRQAGNVSQALVAGQLVLSNPAALNGVLIDNVIVKKSDDTVTYVLGEDYEIAYDANYHVVISRIADGAIGLTDTLHILYDLAKPSGVLTSDIISAMAAIDNIYAQHLLIPGQIVAPKWSLQTDVAAAMFARAENIDDSFRCSCVFDISTDAATGADLYTEVNGIKDANNWTDPRMRLCWPLVKGTDGKTYHMSTHYAGARARATYDNNDIPSNSPSNKRLEIMGCVTAAGAAVSLGRSQANTLNGQGIITALNWGDGWKLWGSRTAGYPTTTDPKDSIIPNRDMGDFLANMLVSTFFANVDLPLNRRTVEMIENTVNDKLNAYKGSGDILYGIVQFLAGDNPISSIIDGNAQFRMNWCPAGVAEAITFIMTIDPSKMSASWD